MIWHGFYYLQSGNGVGPILTAPEPTRGVFGGELMSQCPNEESTQVVVRCLLALPSTTLNWCFWT